MNYPQQPQVSQPQRPMPQQQPMPQQPYGGQPMPQQQAMPQQPYPGQPMPQQQPPQVIGQAPPAAPQPAGYGPGQYPQQAAPAQPQAAPYQAPRRPTRGKGTMLVGAGLVAIGAVITVITYLVADPGGTYIVAFGPVIAGIATFIRGLFSYLGSRIGTR